MTGESDALADSRFDGFATASAMRAAHGPIVDLAAELLKQRLGPVLDLGCGSGALLEALTREREGILPCGVEIDPQRAAYARMRLEPYGGTVFEGDLFEVNAPWTEFRWALVLLMPGRLLEVDDRRVAKLRRRLRDTAENVITYAYADWLDRFGDLDGLVAAAGLGISPPEVDDVTGHPLWRTCALALAPGAEDR